MAAVKPSHAGSRIMVVDDNERNRELLEILLKGQGYTVFSIVSGQSAIDQVGKIQPQLVLLDIIMPDMSGLEVCTRLKADKATAEIPVLFVTASTDDELLRQAFSCGGEDYVRKPINRTELFARIESALSRQLLVQALIDEERLKSIIEMAGAVCHELNQPLQFISSAVEMLLMTPNEDHGIQMDYLNNIKTQVDRMGAITRKLMHVTRYKTKEYVAGRKIIDIDRSVDA